TALLAVTPEGHEKPAAALIGLLAPDEAAQREMLSFALGGLGHSSPFAATAAYLLASERADWVPDAAASSLGDVTRPSPAVVEALRREISKGHLASACFRAAWKAGPALKGLAPELTAALKRGRQRERLQAALALVSVAPDGAGPAVPVLREACRD